MRGWAGGSVARLDALGPLLTADGSDSFSLDETLDLLLAAGWRLDAALLLAIPEAIEMRGEAIPELDAFRRRTAGMLSPWDGPAALVFSDGRRVGAMLDRNGLRPAAVTITHDGLVAVASEAGRRADHRRRDRPTPAPGPRRDARGRPRSPLDPPRRGRQAAGSALGRWRRPMPRGQSGRRFFDNAAAALPARTTPRGRWLAGLDAERQRLDIKTMALEGHEPLWSMGDDTPTPALSRLDRPVADHLRQSFAQVTNPAIDPERERIVMDMTVELGRRSQLLGAVFRARPRTLRLPSPFVVDLAALSDPSQAVGAARAAGCGRWMPRGIRADGRRACSAALARLAADARIAATDGIELLIISDRDVAGGARLPIPSVLAAGAVHTALTDAGLRGETDLLVDASDILDVHSAAMALAVRCRRGRAVAGHRAGGRAGGNAWRGGRWLPPTPSPTWSRALEKGLRKVLARMGISAVASYVGGQFFEVLELAPEVTQPLLPGGPGVAGDRGLRGDRGSPVAAAGAPHRALPTGDRLPDPGFVRFRGGRRAAHLRAAHRQGGPGAWPARSTSDDPAGDPLAAYRESAAPRRGHRPRPAGRCCSAAQPDPARRGRAGRSRSCAGSWAPP